MLSITTENIFDSQFVKTNNKHVCSNGSSSSMYTHLNDYVWPPFAFRTALILHGIDSTRCWKHSLEMLAHIDGIASCIWWRFVGCTSRGRSSRSTTSQRCSIGLRSGDCGGHFSTVNSLSGSRNQFEIIRALWHGALSCWK